MIDFDHNPNVASGRGEWGLQEEWRPVVGWEGWYEVSTLGRARRVSSRRLLKPTPRHKGYLAIWVSRPGEHVRLNLAKAVLVAFGGNWGMSLQVNHLNGNKTDNRVFNLEWVTGSENVRHWWDKLRDRSTCPRGHMYTAANVYHHPAGHRRCRICKREEARRYKLRRKLGGEP